MLYRISVGGDFMSGRFFTMPFLVAVMVISREVGSLASYAADALVLYDVLIPIAPTPGGEVGYVEVWLGPDEKGDSHLFTVFDFAKR